MSKNNTLLSKRFIRPVKCVLFLLVASLWPGSLMANVSVTATKDCFTSPCTVVEAQFTILVAQTIHWQANYTGSATQGHSFYLSTVASNLADIPLTTSGQLSGTHVLQPGTYFISIRLALMGPGSYTVTYNPSSTGDPHIATINGMYYDFQSAGEFVLLHHPDGLEIQTRQTPVATTFNPGPDPHDGIAACVSINTAIAAQAGKHRITYEPNLSGVPDPSGLQLRVDGVLTTLGVAGLTFEDHGRITKTAAPGGLEIDFPDRSVLLVTPGWWANQSKWYLNVDIVPARVAAGIAGVIGPDTWLPALPDGTSMGPMPRLLHARFVDLYQTFSDAWRVTHKTSLFDYAPGASTETFTLRNWPPEQPPCVIPQTTPVEPVSELVAKQACQLVTGENAHCVFDVMVTGNTGFARTYVLSQGLQAHPITKSSNMTLILILGGFLLVAAILVLIFLLRR